MTNYKLDAMFEIRKYLWAELLDKGIFVEEDYYSDNVGETLIPIFPVQQLPEMDQFLSGKKHIVYDKIGLSYEDMWAVCCEQILFTLYATDVLEINEMRNLMVDAFRRMDDTARDVNNSSGLLSKFKFFSIFVAEISPTAPSEDLQGFMAADVILEVKYARQIAPNGRFI